MKWLSGMSPAARETAIRVSAAVDKQHGYWVSYKRGTCHLVVWRHTTIHGIMVLGRFSGRIKQVYSNAEEADGFMPLLHGLDLEPSAQKAVTEHVTGSELKSDGFDTQAPEPKIVARRRRKVKRGLL